MLKAIVNDLSTVDEAHKPFYTQKDDKFVLNVTPVDGYELDNVGGLKTALGAERNLKAGLEGKLKVFEGLDATQAKQALAALNEYGDITPAQAKEFKTKFEELSKIDPSKDADRISAEKVEAATTALKAQFSLREVELTNVAKAANETVESLTTQIKTLTEKNQITTELAKLNPLDDARDAIELLVSQSVKSTVKDGKVVTEVLDANGHPRIKDAAGTPLTIADLLAEMKEQRPGLFKADQIAGIGLKPGNPGGGGSAQVNPWKTETFNRTQQAILTNTKPELAKRLKAEAGVA